MAISTPVEHDAFFTQTNGTSDSSASFTPTAGAILLVFFGARATTGVLSIAESHAGSWSWTKLDEQSFTDGVSYDTAVFYATVPASPGSGAVTISTDGDAWDACNMNVIEVDGASGTISNWKFAQQNSASPSVTLDTSPDAASCVLGLLYVRGDETGVSPGSGFTEISEATAATPSDCSQVQYDLTPVDGVVDWSSVATNEGAEWAIELEEFDAGTPVGSLPDDTFMFSEELIFNYIIERTN